MEPSRTSKLRRAIQILSYSTLLVFTGSCSSIDPEGCAVPPRALAAATNTALAPFLSASIRHSRKTALNGDARSIPDQVRTVLESFFNKSTLDDVRWTVTSDDWTLDALIASAAPRYAAMTFGDTIVFRSEADADEIALWVHELLHVEQFKRAGSTLRFSRAYLASWEAIETTTVRQTNHILSNAGVQTRQEQPTLRSNCESGDDPALE